MKIVNIGKVLFGCLFLFGLCQATLCQGKEVSYSDVIKLEQSAVTLLKAVPYRSTMTNWVFPERGKEPSWKSILIRETVRPDLWREVQENFSPASVRRTEVVFVGGNFYQKLNDGPWQLRQLPPPPVALPTTAGITASRPRFEVSARLIETLNDKNGMISVYETKSKSTKEEGGKEISQIATSRVWFRLDGLLVKKDFELETVGESRILKNSTVYEYEDIKIEAPIP